MKVVTAAEMREIDRITIEEYGIPGLVLMERAGLAVAERVQGLFPGREGIVLCGTGNNGGDGIVAARILHNRGVKVKVIILTEGRNLSPDCEAQHRIASRIGLSVEFRDRLKKSDLERAGVLMDAVFGTGLTRPVSDQLAAVFELVNRSPIPVVSVDIPSGVSSDTGEIMGAAIRADHTVTFGLPKRGHLLHPGAALTGELSVADIGFPRSLMTSKKLSVTMVEREELSTKIPPRRKESHKGDYGHVLIVAGSPGKTGAALMTARACLRAGAGLVTLACPQSVMKTIQGRVLEEMLLPLADDERGVISGAALKEILRFSATKADVLAIGPGLSVSEGTRELLRGLITEAETPLVIDADGLNSLQDPSLLSRARRSVILTPHPGEMARLIQKTEVRGQNTEDREIREKIEMDRIGTALSFSKATGAHLVLKGAPTITAGPDGEAFINTTGNPGMATAGSGDLLTGVIAGLLGQGLSPLDAAVTAVYIHGLAGDFAAKEKGEQSLIASDILEHLPSAFISLGRLF